MSDSIERRNVTGHSFLSMSECEFETISPLNYCWEGKKKEEIANGDGNWLRLYKPSIHPSNPSSPSIHSSIHLTNTYGAPLCVRAWESDRAWQSLDRSFWLLCGEWSIANRSRSREANKKTIVSHPAEDARTREVRARQKQTDSGYIVEVTVDMTCW